MPPAKRTIRILLLGSAIAAAAGGACWWWLMPDAPPFLRARFSVVDGKTLHYDAAVSQWRAAGKKLHIGQAIANGRGIRFQQSAEMRLAPGRRGRSLIFFSYAIQSFAAHECNVAIVHRSRGRERILRRLEVAHRARGYFSSELHLGSADTILVRASGSGAMVLGDALITGVKARERRRYVFVVAPDTFRADRLGKRRNGRSLTPNLQAFSRDAVVFENAVAASAWTLPSFASFFSAQYEFRHRVTKGDPLSPDQPHLLAGLAPNHAIVNFNGGAWFSPRYGMARHSDCYLTTSKTKEVYADRHMFDIAKQFLQAAPLPSLFMFLHTYKLHAPYEPAGEFLAKIASAPTLRRSGSFVKNAQFRSKVPDSKRRAMEELYDGEVLQFDYFFGDFIAFLKRIAIYDQSLIVLLSDHGEEFGEHGGWFHGHSLYQEISRVPFVIKFPRGEHAGRRFREFVSLCDALPTVLDFLKIRVPGGIDGISLMPMIRGSRPQRRVICSSATASLFDPHLPMRSALFFGHHKLIFNFPMPAGAGEFFREFGQPPPRPEIELYDLQADPREQNDISSRQGHLIDSQRPQLARILAEIRRPRKAKKKNIPLSDEEIRLMRSLGYL